MRTVAPGTFVATTISPVVGPPVNWSTSTTSAAIAMTPKTARRTFEVRSSLRGGAERAVDGSASAGKSWRCAGSLKACGLAPLTTGGGASLRGI